MDVAEIVVDVVADCVAFDVADEVPDAEELVEAETVREEFEDCDDELVLDAQNDADDVPVGVRDGLCVFDADADGVEDSELVADDVNDTIVGPAEADASFDRTEPEGVFEATDIVMPEEAVIKEVELVEAERLLKADADSALVSLRDDVADPDFTVEPDEDAVGDCVSISVPDDSVDTVGVVVEVTLAVNDDVAVIAVDSVDDDDCEDVSHEEVEALREGAIDAERLPVADTDRLPELHDEKLPENDDTIELDRDTVDDRDSISVTDDSVEGVAVAVEVALAVDVAVTVLVEVALTEDVVVTVLVGTGVDVLAVVGWSDGEANELTVGVARSEPEMEEEEDGEASM